MLLMENVLKFMLEENSYLLSATVSTSHLPLSSKQIFQRKQYSRYSCIQDLLSVYYVRGTAFFVCAENSTLKE